MLNASYVQSRLEVKIKNYRKRIEMKREPETTFEWHQHEILEAMTWEYYDAGIIDSDSCYRLIEELQKILNLQGVHTTI